MGRNVKHFYSLHRWRRRKGRGYIRERGALFLFHIGRDHKPSETKKGKTYRAFGVRCLVDFREKRIRTP